MCSSSLHTHSTYLYEEARRCEEWQDGRRSQKVCLSDQFEQIWGREMRRFAEEKDVRRSGRQRWMDVNRSWQSVAGKGILSNFFQFLAYDNTLDGHVKLYGLNGLSDWLSISLSAVFDFRFLCVMRRWVSIVTQLLSYNTKSKWKRKGSVWWVFFSQALESETNKGGG